MFQTDLWKESWENGDDQRLFDQRIRKCIRNRSGFISLIFLVALLGGVAGELRNLSVDQIDSEWFCAEDKIELIGML